MLVASHPAQQVRRSPRCVTACRAGGTCGAARWLPCRAPDRPGRSTREGPDGHDVLESDDSSATECDNLRRADRELRTPAPAATPPAVVELSVVLPCLNEAETLATCIRKARRSFATLGVVGEVVVADNGSTDGSQDIARAEGAASSTSRGGATGPR